MFNIVAMIYLFLLKINDIHSFIQIDRIHRYNTNLLKTK